MVRRSRSFGLFEYKTGQVLPAGITLWREQVGGAWMRLFLESKRRLLLQARGALHGQSLLVLHYLETAVDWQNVLPSRARTVVELGVNERAVARSYRELEKAGFILKVDGVYYLSPLVGWRGSEQQLREAYVRLLPAQPLNALKVPKALAEPKGRYSTRPDGGR